MNGIINSNRTSGAQLIISGPCSAETEEQVMRTAAETVAEGITSVFRAGIWKPRTKPNTFEGVGEEGLKWLQQVKATYGLPCATEVGNARHVEQALKHGIDVLWIGARTTVNPFCVQEIADALQGAAVTVMVKNPINPELDLWIGAMERLEKAGIENLIAIHRGFSVHKKSHLRNEPLWQIPMALRQQLPGMPIICDPSHIAGHTKHLQEVMNEAQALHFDGLIVETHHNPAEAWSDAKQQITPKELAEMVESTCNGDIQVAERRERIESLGHLRALIDDIDEQLLEIIAQRMEVAERIGGVKKLFNQPPVQNERWAQLLAKNINKGAGKGLSEGFLRDIFTAIHQESLSKQRKVMGL